MQAFPDFTIKGMFDDVSQDIKVQIIHKVRDSLVFAMQCNETADIAQCSQLLGCTRLCEAIA